jgi:hypothetical protein
MTEITCKMDDGIEVILSDSDRIGDLIGILRKYNQPSMMLCIESDAYGIDYIDERVI